jgi:hypothetical protein
MSLGFLQSVIKDTAANVAKKRSRVDEVVTATGNKWLKRGEIEAIKAEVEAAEKAKRRQQKDATSAALTNNNNNNNKTKNDTNSKSSPPHETANGTTTMINGVDDPIAAAVAAAAAAGEDVVAVVQQKMTGISPFEVQKLLRQYGQPITLFGEVCVCHSFTFLLVSISSSSNFMLYYVVCLI